jgi:hypothetical protein
MNPVLPLELVLLAAVVALLASGFACWRSSRKAPRGVRGALLALRLAGVAGVAALALNPGRWWHPERRPGRDWAVLVDRSASMATADVQGRARWDEARRLAAAAVDAVKPPDRVKVYPFAADLEDAADAAALARRKPDGAATDIARAGSAALSRYAAAEPLAGLVVISDGRATARTPPAELAARALARGTAIHTLPLGGAVPRRDLALQAGRQQLVAYVGQKLSLGGRVLNSNLGAVRPVVRLFDAAGATLGEQTLALANGASGAVAFEVVPRQPGYQRFRLVLDVWPDECNRINNETEIGVSVLNEPMRVLLAEGTPYWDSKFLAQLLRKQANMTLHATYRVRTDRFFRIQPDGSGFLAPGQTPFPSAQDDLNRYDLVVLGKGAEYLLSPAQVGLLREFVRERGGCVVFARGKPYAGEFAELSALEPVEWGEMADARFVWKPAPAGEQAGLFGGTLPGSADAIWQRLPTMANATQVRRLKAFTTVLCEGVAQGGAGRPFPAVVSGRYGRGMTVTVNSEGLWQWDFVGGDPQARELYEKLWTQLLQWAVTGADFLPGQNLAVRVHPSIVGPGETVRIAVRSRSAVPDDSALRLRVVAADGAAEGCALARAPGADAVWDSLWTATTPGLYRCEASEAGSTGTAVHASVQVQAPPGEGDELSADPAFLEALAVRSDGRVVDAAALAAVFVRRAESFDWSTAGVAVWEPHWVRAWIALPLLALFGVEWFLRRRNGLL